MTTQTIPANALRPVTTAHTIRIRIPRAQHVSLIGDFNDWHTNDHPLVQIAPGLWERAVNLPPGQHRYAFFVVDDLRHTGGTLRTHIEGQGAVLWVPENPEHAVSITSYPAVSATWWRKPERISA